LQKGCKRVPFLKTVGEATGMSRACRQRFFDVVRRSDDRTFYGPGTYKVTIIICVNLIIQSIHQVSDDSSTPDKKFVLWVSQYFNAIQRLTSFLPKSSSWSIDVTQHFLSHLLVDIRDQMKGQGHNYDQDTASRAPFAQISACQTAFSACSLTLSELSLQRVFKEYSPTRSQVYPTHAFHTKLTNNMSVAEKTIQRHQERNVNVGSASCDKSIRESPFKMLPNLDVLGDNFLLKHF
jgi:hypothetical protein